jgi:CheY-like chemotaxis protein
MMPVNKNRILVVDDDPDILSLIGYVFESSGYKIDLVSNGIDALRFLKSQPDLPAFILLDVMMPLMSGDDFIHEIEKDPALAGVVIVVMSASGEDVVRKKGIGERKFIEKPVSLDTLIDVARQYCATP